jgi:hypothetical protein
MTESQSHTRILLGCVDYAARGVGFRPPYDGAECDAHGGRQHEATPLAATHALDLAPCDSARSMHEHQGLSLSLSLSVCVCVCAEDPLRYSCTVPEVSWAVPRGDGRCTW